ncbi:hypothetical protein KFK09_010552 [Dendrobium nobile]|uniref:Integrase catalytic domain-containing protein n=1 Tax=Dendrobium nobile TaxID=94219 RepID=A0A8T3BA79_DENNO|nr:hypothetical protein KFK09_010552 [Dendrobium nobile]
MTSSSSQMAYSATNHLSDDTQISATLKFVVSNVRNFVTTPLQADNYAIWKSQIQKILRANGFLHFLDSNASPPPPCLTNADGSSSPNPLHTQWLLHDQNLSASICSTISSSVLPYVISLDSTADLWTALENRFQATNRSKIIQLWNALHQVSLKNQSMTQYLSEIKIVVDQITAAGASVDAEDVIHHILNGLPHSYQSFKTAIRTMQTPLSLDQLYPLLLSEEINITSDAARAPPLPDPATALFTTRGRGRRSRGRPPSNSASQGRNPATALLVCQICYKKGHTAQSCWHRMNAQFVPQSRTTNTALMASPDAAPVSWYLNSGASSHLTNSLENLAISQPYQGQDNITIGDGSSVNIANSGAGILPTPNRKLLLSKIFHTPSLKFNLLSISQLTKDNNISIIFDPSGFTLKDLRTHKVILQGPCEGGLYSLPTTSTSASQHALSATSPPINHWHHRLGHPHTRISDIISNCNPHLSINKSRVNCTFCNASKCHKQVFEFSCHRQNMPLAMIHSDVWGPAPVTSSQGYRFYVIFVDDFSRYTWIFPLQHKSDVFHTFVNFKTYIERFTNNKIKILRTDGGAEFVNLNFKNYLRSQGILHQLSCPYTPEQNGLAERKHRHIIETTRTMLLTASVPYVYWPDATITSVYLINRLPTPSLNNLSPIELFHKTKPNYSNLKIFGFECFPLNLSHSNHKLQPKSQSCIFLGYSDNYKGYKCLDPSTNKIIMSRHVTFNENVFPFSKLPNNSSSISDNSCPLLLTPTSLSSLSNTTSHINSINRKSGNQLSVSPHTPAIPPTTNSTISIAPQPANSVPIPTHHMVTRSRTGSIKQTQRLNLIHAQTDNTPSQDPSSYTEAVKKPEWRQAMACEFLALQKQGTWTLVQPPTNASILGSKWTYRTKFHTDGSVAKYKARLVAQGNTQEFGIDYTETFSPVAKLPTIRILLAVALYHEWPVQQLDVANAFLHGSLTETVYMSQPRGFEDNLHPDYVCRLHKAIYGLKQAPRQWYNTFTSFLASLGFSHSKADPSLMIYRKEQIQIFLLVYVDDILITGNNQECIRSILTRLSNKFSMKHLGQATEFLGIKIQKLSTSYFLSQSKYALSILTLADLSRCNPLANPTCTKPPAQFIAEPFLADPALYRRITGSLQYLTLTRPDIAFSVNMLSQHMHDPKPAHIYMLKRLLRYIKGTLQFGLPITKTNLLLKSFSDADWAGDPITRRSTSGYCSFLGDTLISWTVKKQRTVSRSSTESEYRALAALTVDIIWLRKLLTEFGIKQDYATDLYCDNMSAIALANNPIFHSRTKHIEIDQKFLRDQIQQNNIRLHPISTLDQIADIFTKSLSTPRFHQLRLKLTVCQDPSICPGVLEQTSKSTV